MHEPATALLRMSLPPDELVKRLERMADGREQTLEGYRDGYLHPTYSGRKRTEHEDAYAVYDATFRASVGLDALALRQVIDMLKGCKL